MATDADAELVFKWILHGHVVVSRGNPCLLEDKNDDDDNENTHNLGCGVSIKLNHVVAVNKAGIIVHVEPAQDFYANVVPEETCQRHAGYLRLAPTAFLCPGMIDLHIHAAQYAFAGTGTDRPLMGPEGWLETYTFPTEAAMKDLQYAQKVYETVVQRTLSLGTTTAVYFATLDAEPTKLLVDIVLKQGQRALIGKVCMDRNAPDNYCQSTEQNLREARDVLQYVVNHPSPRQQSTKDTILPLVLPLVTPRFIPTCTPALMDGLGELAKEYQCHITSHISESHDEVQFSKVLAEQDYHGSPSPLSDADVFDSHRLLTDKCIMAHGVHLTRADLNLMKQRRSAVAHCPLSNFFFAGGSLPCKHLMKHRNKVGLGTDIAGGYHPSMMESARSAVVASLALKHQWKEKQQQRKKQHAENKNDKEGDTADEDDPTIDFRHAFWLATAGGAEALGLQDRIGSLQVGMAFDAFVLGESSTGWPDTFNFASAPDPNSQLGDMFQKLWNLGDDRNISHVFVQGNHVHHNH